MGQNSSNSKVKDNLKESGEHLDASNGKDMKNIEEKMQKLETEGTEQPKMEGQIESEKCNEAKKEENFFVPNWLIESLASITRIEMADSKLSTSCRAFNQLCEPKLHGNVKPHKVGWMDLVGEPYDGTWNERAFAYYGGQLLPIPSTPPPEYILGFEHIRIRFLDDSVLKFIKCIAPKLDGIKFVMKGTWMLRCLLNALDGRIGYFHFGWGSNFKMFNSHFPNFIDQYLTVSISGSKFQKPEFDVLFEWLTNRRQMDAGKQKVLRFTAYVHFANFFGRIKEEFSDSTKPLNFLIQLNSALPEYDVDLENENTREVFISYHSEEFCGKLILRCPKGQEERWKKEGKEKLNIFTSDDVTSISMDIENFGTLTDLA